MHHTHTLTLIPKDNLDSLIDIIVHLFVVVNPEKFQADTYKTCKPPPQPENVYKYKIYI